jgi:hypothetical protein
MNRAYFSAAAASLLFLSACAPDAVVDDIQINLGVKVDQNAVAGDLIEIEKNISTEQGNPYGNFLNEIAAEIDINQVFIELDSVDLTLEGDATHAAFESLFVETLELIIVAESNNVETAIASVTEPLGAGPLALDVLSGVFDNDELQTTLREGSFKLKLVGVAADGAAAADVNVVATLRFEAFE